MQTYTPQQIDLLLEKRLLLLPEEVREFLVSAAFKTQLITLTNEIDISEPDRKEIRNLVFLFLMLYSTKSTFLSKLENIGGMGTQTAQMVLDSLMQILPEEVTALLREAEDQAKNQAQAKRQELRDLQQTLSAPKKTEDTLAEVHTIPKPPPETSQEPPQSNTVPPQDSTPVVQPMRTMQTDMSLVHGYGAYRSESSEETHEEDEEVHTTNQDDILTAHKEDVPPPKYGVDEEKI